MLLHLHIRNFAIVPALEQDFAPGFTAISGETGAGKSILVDALGLLLGARSDAGWVRSGADRAELNAEFSLAANAAAADWLREHELADGESVLLRRTIQAGGRSRAWVNGTPVTVAQLADLGNLLVEVHGQNEHVRLAGAGRQRALLDRTGDYDAALADVDKAFETWRRAEDTLRELAEGAALPPSELEFLKFQLDELEAQDLDPEVIGDLEQEHRLLSSSGELVSTLEHCGELLENDQAGATAQLAAVLTALEPYLDLKADIREARRMVDEALINAREAAGTLAAVAAGVDLDPARLRGVTSKLSSLGDLARKHGVELEGLAEVRDRLTTRLDQAAHFDERREELEHAVAQALSSYDKHARRLSKKRSGHAATLSKAVEKLMGELGMAGGRFLIDIEHVPDGPPSPTGRDSVTMRVSANPGIDPAPLAKVASGGELSRISLALKVATADGGARTQVFDEIDSGVGGDTANAVGELLKAAAAGGQALCVTHLAQVAVRADQQLKVTKQAEAKDTSVDASVLGGDDRVEEIARMLGGKVSEQSRAHAREMLQAGDKTRH